MNPNDVRAVIMGIGWIIFFFAPLALSMIALDSDPRDRSFLIILALLLQLALIISIGHSWVK